MSITFALAEHPFRTIQGEGINAGRVALFVRFAGCNLWSGLDEHRERDAQRHRVECPRFCDTDFRPKVVYSIHDLVAAVVLHRHAGVRLIVFTGGEPFLHLRRELLELLPPCEFAVETNGTVRPRDGVHAHLHHVCVSPKVSPDRLVLRSGDELKVVAPGYLPAEYERAIDAGELDFTHLFVQPRARLDGIDERAVHDAVDYVLANPRWRLSYQTHKTIGVP